MPSYNKMRLAVGLFIITLFLFIGASLFFLLKEKGAFDKHYNYHFTSDSAEFIKVGMPVKFSGFDIGAINDIKLLEDGSVNITFSITQEYRKWLTDGSILMIIKPLIGSPHIVLFTSLDTKLLEPEANLELMTSDGINDLILRLEPALATATHILDNVDKITTYLADEDSELKHILRNFETLSAKLAKSNSLLTSVTGDAKSTKELTDALSQSAKIAKDIKKITNDIATITASLDKSIMQPAQNSVNEIEHILKDITAKLDALDSTVKTAGSFSPELVDIKEQIRVGVEKSNMLMDKVDALLGNEDKEGIDLP